MTMNVSGFESWNRSDLYEAIVHRIYKRLIYNGIYVQLKGLYLVGSRVSDAYKPDSTLDIIFVYEGDEREDALFNMINNDPIMLDGIRVDVDPRRNEFTSNGAFISLI